jgi:aminoglycoside N3'-acetyltransferase
VTDLVADLRALGVRHGDVLMVHASLRRVGARAEAVVDAIDAALGPDGTWMMTLGADERAFPFSALLTPADPDVGVLAEVFRTTPGTVVSDHPDGRFGARGALAADLTASVPWDDYYGPGSPLERFVQLGGRVLRLGADLDTVTLLHWAEYLVDVPDKRRVRREHEVLVSTGDVRRVAVECLDDSDGIVDVPGEDYFARILRAYLAADRAVGTGQVGGATSELIDGADLVTFGVEWMSTNLR